MKVAHYWNKAIDPALHVPLRISVGAPRFKPKGYEIAGVLLDLAPDRWFLKKYGEDQPSYEREYRAKLDRIGIESVQTQLAAIEDLHPDRELVLLCFEDLAKPGTWCHRTIFSTWWHEQTGETIDELGALQGHLIER